MYQKIYVPLDNSDHSNACIDVALAMAGKFGAEVVGSHVYSAKMHDYRFKQMEYTLPDEYLVETELERQRRIHDSLITMGLELISDSYLDVLEARAKEQGVPMQRKMMDGKHYREIIRDVQASDYDLMVLGSLGCGAVRDSLIGSVAERVMRKVDVDTLLVKNVAPNEDNDSIVVGVDGSPQSFAALKTAVMFAKWFGKRVKAIGVYDPYLHYTVFNGIVDVLSERASKVFRFKEQEQLHEEIIDTGLAKIYQSHLEVARAVAEEDGVEIETVLLPGKCFEKVLQFCRKEKPWLLVLGRVGVHTTEEEGHMDLGSNTENLLRGVPCNVFITAQKYFPKIDLKAEESIAWSKEALDRMENVPPLVRGVAKTGVLRYAMERGHSVITSKIIDEAMEAFMPEGMLRAMGEVARDVMIGQIVEQQTLAHVCSNCGYTARSEKPHLCPVCRAAGDTFKVLDKQVLESLYGQQHVEETTFDGVRLKWSEEARMLLKEIKDGYQKRRAKARIEKQARVLKLAAISADFAKSVLAEELGEEAANVISERSSEAPKAQEEGFGYVWEEAALGRLSRVPAGFMRNMTRRRVEEYAREAGADIITLAVAEEGINKARELMGVVIGEYRAKRTANPAASAEQVLNEIGSGRGVHQGEKPE